MHMPKYASRVQPPVTLGDLQRAAKQALDIASRIVPPGEHVDLPAAGNEAKGACYRVRAMAAGDALVIQHAEHADGSPFSGLLVTRAAAGLPPRLLFDMGPVEAGSPGVLQARKMLDALVTHASMARQAMPDRSGNQ
jgi:hypothetical protein